MILSRGWIQSYCDLGHKKDIVTKKAGLSVTVLFFFFFLFLENRYHSTVLKYEWHIFCIMFSALTVLKKNKQTRQVVEGCCVHENLRKRVPDTIAHVEFSSFRDLSEISRGEGGGKQGRVTAFRALQKGGLWKKLQEKREGHEELSHHDGKGMLNIMFYKTKLLSPH